MPGGYHRRGRRTAGDGKLYNVPGEGNIKLQFKGIARKGPKFRGGPTEPQMHWNFLALHIKNAPVTRSLILE